MDLRAKQRQRKIFSGFKGFVPSNCIHAGKVNSEEKPIGPMILHPVLWLHPPIPVCTNDSLCFGGEFQWTQLNYSGPTPGLWFRQDNWELIGSYLLGVCSHNNDSLDVAQLCWHLRKKKKLKIRLVLPANNIAKLPFPNELQGFSPLNGLKSFLLLSLGTVAVRIILLITLIVQYGTL